MCGGRFHGTCNCTEMWDHPKNFRCYPQLPFSTPKMLSLIKTRVNQLLFRMQQRELCKKSDKIVFWQVHVKHTQQAAIYQGYSRHSQPPIHHLVWTQRCRFKSYRIDHVILMEEILHHLGCLKSFRYCDKLPWSEVLLSTVKSIIFLLTTSKNKIPFQVYQGIVGCTPTNVPLLEIPI